METLIAIFALISGGVIWEGFKFFYPDLKQLITAKANAKRVLYENLDPILKAANELFGKLESLAHEDFSTFINTKNSTSNNPEHNRKYILYLFSQFWAQLESLRLLSQYTSLSRTKKGAQLLMFIDTMESKKYRVLDRSIQRILGECLLTSREQKFKVMTLKEFLDEIEKSDSSLSKWSRKLEDTLIVVDDHAKRQRILRFGVIVNAFIEHFDPRHKTVRNREIYKNKLSRKSNEIIKNHLLTDYLPFLENKERYYTNKKSPQANFASKKLLKPLDSSVSLELESIKEKAKITKNVS